MTTQPSPPAQSAPVPPPIADTAPPSAFNVAGKMIGGAVKSTAAKIVGAVIAAIVLLWMLIVGIASGPGDAAAVLVAAIFILGVLAFVVAIPTAIVVLIIAATRARKMEVGAMQGYANQRGLAFAPQGRLPNTTPLLTAGTRRDTQDLMTGALPGGLQGTLAHYTFYIRHQSSQGQSSTTPYPHTVVVTQLPESAIFVKRLTCHSLGRLKTISLFGLDFSSDEEVHLESAVVNERFQIRTSGSQDQAWLRELFTPVFIDWLAAGTPEGFGFSTGSAASPGTSPTG